MSTDNDMVQLGPDERLTGRPFTDPEHSERELGYLRTLFERMRHHLYHPDGLPEDQRPIIIRDDDERGRFRRTVISLPDRLRSGERLTVVGFFGIRQPNDFEEEADEVDDALVEEIPGRPYVASYCSMLLEDGPHQGNLILMTEEEGIELWKEGARHTYAAQVLAPKLYSEVRLYHGEVAEGWESGADLTLTRAKYYDLSQDPWWRAVREGPVA